MISPIKLIPCKPGIWSRFSFVNLRHLRYLESSSQSSSSAVGFEPERVVDKIYNVRDLDLPKDVKIQPLADLEIKESIVHIKKSGSFVKHLFIGRFDTDFLTYPEILKTRKEYDRVITQCEMVERNFKNFLTPDALQELNFYMMYRWTVTEMMSVFEAIGSAMVIKPKEFDYEDPFTPDTKKSLISSGIRSLLDHSVIQPQEQHKIFDLLNQNCLGLASIEWSDNENLRNKFLNLHDQNPDLKIGWAWCERQLPFGAGDFVDWETIGSKSKEHESWILNGQKNRILKGDYDYYAIFAKTYDYSEDEDPDWLLRGKDIPPGIVGFMVPKNMIGTIEDDEVVNGLQFQKIKFDYLNLPTEDHLLIDPSPLGIRSQNIQGIGYLGVSSFILGMLKALLKDTYTYLTKKREPLLSCESVEKRLCEITFKIYALESCIYLTSQAHDCFDNVNSDPEVFLESAICKILAVEYAHDILRILQSLYGSEMLILSPLSDYVNLFDTYLNNTVHHRNMVGKFGMWMAGYFKNDHIRKMRLAPFFPLYKLKQFLLSHKIGPLLNPNLTSNLKGHVHPSMVEEADDLERVVHQFGLGVEWLLFRWTKRTTRRQNDLERAAQMAIDIFTMTCVLSRASKTYCDAGRNCEIDRLVMKGVFDELVIRAKLTFELINGGNIDTDDFRNFYTHRKNIEYGGYFAQTGLHKIRY